MTLHAGESDSIFYFNKDLFFFKNPLQDINLRVIKFKKILMYNFTVMKLLILHLLLYRENPYIVFTRLI